MKTKSIRAKEESLLTGKKNVKLEYSEINKIIETLLFASSINIGAEWGEKENLEFVNLALYLKGCLPEEAVLPRNLTFYVDEGLQEPWSNTIQQNFNITSFNVEALER
jgi:hypothetical protein